MKIGIFTDSHYSSQASTCGGTRFNSRSLEKIKEAYNCFAERNCDLVVCLGDLIDREDTHLKEIENLKAVARVINASGPNTVCVMGNHDAFAFTPEEFYKFLGGYCPDRVEKDNKTLLFLDACYFKNGRHYAPGDSDWMDTYYPFEERLKEELETAKGDIYIFMHQNIDINIPENHLIFNAQKLRQIIEKSGKVKTVFQGHYHEGAESVINGVDYKTFPAMCEGEKRYWVIEI